MEAIEPIPPHNDGPEHWCGLCRLGLPHSARPLQKEHLIVRCRARGIITDAGVDYLLGLLK